MTIWGFLPALLQRVRRRHGDTGGRIPGFGSVSFDTTGLSYQGERDNVRAWRSESGDGIGLYHFAVPPSIPTSLADAQAVRSFYRRLALSSNIGFVEADVFELQGGRALRVICKAVQYPDGTGRTYLGSITLPFRDFSFVIKAHCPELGTTGVRESVVLDRLLRSGGVRLQTEAAQGALLGPGWITNREDDSLPPGLARNVSEDEAYDAEFPDDPLSRARAFLRRVQATLILGDDLRNAPEFTGPDPR
jgi:hypothetical protein